jgi:peptide/nickel transport system ATP-binding protein
MNIIDDDVLLSVRGLKVHFSTDEGLVRAVDGVDFDVRRGRTLCIVGESGSGKSVTARAILQIVSTPGRVTAGQMLLARRDASMVDIATLRPDGAEIRSIRGREIAMIFQEPMNSLSPVHTVGNQLVEKVRLHHKLSQRAAVERAVQALGRVGIPDPAARLHAYPFELSGGMRQRVMIAMALACRPALLIADEPTTALDVTTQANILGLIRELQAEFGMTVMFITHDLGVVAEIADDVAVMYLGQVAERGSAEQIFYAPLHPYTKALLASVPRLGARRRTGGRLASISGMVPHPLRRPGGCVFHTRCTEAIGGVCDRIEPATTRMADGQDVRCHLYATEPAA